MLHGISSFVAMNHRITTAWLDRVWEAGIPLVELFCARQSVDYRNPAQMAELGHWFKDSQLKLHSVHAPLYRDDCNGRTGPGSVVNIADTSRFPRLEAVDEVKRAIEIVECVQFKYLILHIGVPQEEYDERKVEAAFNSVAELNVFARDRGVEILLENIPNRMSSAERLLGFLSETRLENGFCFDTGHAQLTGNLEREWELMRDRVRSTHLHDNDGNEDGHLYPRLSDGGTIDWTRTMKLLRSRDRQYPLMLKVPEPAGKEPALALACRVFELLEDTGHE